MLLLVLHIKIPILFSLGFVAFVLIGSVVLSLLIPPKTDRKIDVELPIEYDEPDTDPGDQDEEVEEPAEIKRA
jgi:hypothetical protein